MLQIKGKRHYITKFSFSKKKNVNKKLHPVDYILKVPDKKLCSEVKMSS